MPRVDPFDIAAGDSMDGPEKQTVHDDLATASAGIDNDNTRRGAFHRVHFTDGAVLKGEGEFEVESGTSSYTSASWTTIDHGSNPWEVSLGNATLEIQDVLEVYAAILTDGSGGGALIDDDFFYFRLLLSYNTGGSTLTKVIGWPCNASFNSRWTPNPGVGGNVYQGDDFESGLGHRYLVGAWHWEGSAITLEKVEVQVKNNQGASGGTIVPSRLHLCYLHHGG